MEFSVKKIGRLRGREQHCDFGIFQFFFLSSEVIRGAYISFVSPNSSIRHVKALICDQSHIKTKKKKRFSGSISTLGTFRSVKFYFQSPHQCKKQTLTY